MKSPPIGGQLVPAACLLDDLAPLIDIIEALSRAKLNLQRIQLTVSLYLVFLFSLNNLAFCDSGQQVHSETN